MQKVLSARLNEGAVDEVDRLSRHLGISKRQFLEEAIRLRAQQAEREGEKDVWSETSGAWKRRESAADAVRAARKEFQETFERHHRE